MRQKMEDGYVYLIEADGTQQSVIKSWKSLKWDRSTKCWYGPISLELLEKLKRLCGLTVPLHEEMIRLRKIQNAVDAERVKPAEDLKEMYNFPVTKSLYAHQKRAANMALLTFELISPEGETENEIN